MSVITGVKGTVDLDDQIDVIGVGATINVTSWTADVQRDIHDVTPFQDSSQDNQRVKVGGMMHVVGSISGWCDSALAPGIAKLLSMNDPGSTGTAQLATVGPAATGLRYQFKMILSNVNVVIEKTGLATVTASFESTGDVTEETS